MVSVLYQLDFETGSLVWSDELYTAYGFDRIERSNRIEWWTDHIHPDDAMILNAAMDGLTTPSTTEWTVEYRFKKTDNTYMAVQDHATVTRDAAGTAIRLNGTITPKEQT